MSSNSDEFAEQVADELEKLLAAEPKKASIQPPELPPAPELVVYWRRIIAYRDQLCAVIQKWETVPFALGEIPKQNLADLHARLQKLDEEINDKARSKVNPNARGHTVDQLRELAEIPVEADRLRKAYWAELWIKTKDPQHKALTASTLRGELGGANLEELESRARAELDAQGKFSQRSKVALLMVTLAEQG